MGTIAGTAKGLAATAAIAVAATACGSTGGHALPPSAVPQTNADVAAVAPSDGSALSSPDQAAAISHDTSVATPRPGLLLARRHAVGTRNPAAVRTAGAARRQETTPVAGGLVSIPALVPTAFDPSTGAFKGVCTEEWTGDWTGVSVCNVTDAHFDRSTGLATATITDSFTGTYMGDHSKGTLTITETFNGNLLTGSGLVQGRIVASGGDATFRCSTGTVTIPVFLNPAVAYGGYVGTWRHGCGGMTSDV